MASGVKRPFSVAAADWEDFGGRDLDRRVSGHVCRIEGRDHSDRTALYSSPRAEGESYTATRPTPPSSSSGIFSGLPTKRLFDSDASIVLTGIPGCGKSTLAVIASAAMKRRVVDAEKAFQDRSGMPSAAYKKVHGTRIYSRLQTEVLVDILQRHHRHAVIVCSWMERHVQTQLADFSASSPIVYITRDAKAIKNYLRIWDDARIQNLLNASAFVFRRCTHLEFFNVSEEPSGSLDDVSADRDSRSPAPYLTLKRAERHFLKFLSLVFPNGAIPFVESAFPLASLPTEKRDFTFAMSVRLATLLTNDVAVEDLEAGTDAVEIVVDSLLDGECHQGSLDPHAASEISRVIGHVRRSTVVPIFYHVLLPEPISASHCGKTLLYLNLVLHGLRLVPEYISIDLRLDDTDITYIRSIKGQSKLVGNIAWTESSPPPWTADIWLSYYRKAQRLGCDLVRFTRKVQLFSDNFDVHHVHRSVEALGTPHLPLIAYNIGEAGRHSACFNRVLTSVRPASTPALPNNPNYQPPALTAVEATRAQTASFIYAPKKLFVMGANVSYSMSPPMHSAALAACGLPHTYEPYSTSSISSIQDLVRDPRFGGASIGLPFKVEVIALTDSLSRHARAVGAVNTLIPVRRLLPDGSIPEDFLVTQTRDQYGPIRAIYGENTDWVGIRACLRRGLSPANAVRPVSSGLVIGAGGMARAAVYAMLQLGVKNIAIFNRTVARAESLVEHFTQLLARDDFSLLTVEPGVRASFCVLKSRDDDWPASMRLPTMIISCIPTHGVGGAPAPDFTVPPAWLGSPTGGVVLELAYKTLNTPLLEQSRREAARGWVTMDGLDLLPEQGFAQFELFTGRRAPRRIMRREVFQAYPADDQDQSSLRQLQPRLDNIVQQVP